MSARETALLSLIACRRQQAWSDGILKQTIRQQKLDRRDAALASRLCYGVLQNRMLLDFWLSAYVKGNLNALQPVVLDILRLAAFQLRRMDRIPASAAVNEAVEQTKRHANARAAGLVNGVLRSMLRDPERCGEPDSLAVRYSHPEPLVRLLARNVGPEALEPLLASHNSVPPTYVQVNLRQTTAEEALESLRADGFTAEPHPWLPGCLELSGGAVENSAAFRSGWVYAQDPAAKLAVLALDPKPGWQVLDCCAAPGGKTLAAAIQMENRGSVVSCDVHPHKIELIRKNASRLGLDCISAQVQDATVPNPAWIDAFDAVLADVPCSGLGVIRKKPDIRYKDLAHIERLPELQAKILDTQAAYVRSGGVLLYSTCTILRRENEDVVQSFLSRHPSFYTEALNLPGGLSAPEGWLTLYPSVHGTDGFFMARMRRKA